MSCKKCKCKVCSCIKNEVPKIAVNGIVQNQNENDVVNIKVPTKTSQLINDSGFGQGNGGGTGGQKIEDIRVNGELVPIINKEAIMNVPTKTTNLINDSNFVTKPYVDTHIVNKANPHNVTKSQIGLGNVDNTSDLNKPISTATQTELNKKLDKPTTNNTPDYVLLADGSTSPKSDFGKVDKVMGVAPDANKNVDISGVATNWTNANQRFSGLVDKSADATYNALLGMDSQGNSGKLTALGNVLESGLQTVPSAQALRIGQLLNGGIGSSGMMSVNMISPPYIKLANEDTYVVLRGANLYLQVDNYRIDITNENGDILANIPNSNIQLRASGTELVFYFNFSTLGQGRYKLRLVSGSKILQTTLSFEVVQNMEIVNLSTTTWEVLEKNGNQDSASVISPTAITLNRLVNDTTTYLPTVSAKSSPIFQAHENWMLEFEVTFRMNLGSRTQGLSKTVAGIDYQSVQHSLIQSGVAYVYWFKVNSAGHESEAQYYESPNQFVFNSLGVGHSGSSHDHVKTLNIIMVKTGNMITINTGGQISTNVVTNGEAYCFLAQISGRQDTNSESMSVKLLTAYKF